MASRGNILIAEDDAVLRGLYEKKFSVEGYATRSASNGEEAINMIETAAPDLLLLDIHMPTVDGFAVLKRYPPKERSFPIMIVTNFADGEFKLRCEELGADHFFVKKDMTIKSLVATVEKVLADWKSHHS